MSVPFRTVAILDPNRCPDTEPASIQAWALRAIERGADAFLLRYSGNHVQYTNIFPALKEIADRNCVILLSQQFEGLNPELADGIHLKSGESLHRPLVQGQLSGRSCHTSEAVRAAKKEGMDYVFVSPVFPTNTHPELPALGLYTFGMICQGNRIPVFGLGGVTKANKARVLDAGAAGIASISMFL